MTHELVIRNMTRPEVDELVAWTAREGWNPGLHDAELFWFRSRRLRDVHPTDQKT